MVPVPQEPGPLPPHTGAGGVVPDATVQHTQSWLVASPPNVNVTVAPADTSVPSLGEKLGATSGVAGTTASYVTVVTATESARVD